MTMLLYIYRAHVGNIDYNLPLNTLIQPIWIALISWTAEFRRLVIPKQTFSWWATSVRQYGTLMKMNVTPTQHYQS